MMTRSTAWRERLFVDKGRPSGTVVLNWHGTPEREFTFFAEAFHLVAQDAVAALRQNPCFGLYGSPVEDFRVYPIVFLYRHALELYMKAVMLLGAPMVRIKGMGDVDGEKLLKNHCLDSFRQDLERVFEAYGWDWDLGTSQFQTLDDFRKTLGGLHSVDARSDAFRYPLDTSGKPALVAHFRFDLFEFCGMMDALLPVFEGATTAAYEDPQATLKYTAEGRRLEMADADFEPPDPLYESHEE